MPKTNNRTHQKRYGHHQRHTAHFLKTYWPYMPLVLIISAMVVLGLGRYRIGRGVLSYATSMSVQELLQDTNQQRQDNHVAPLKLNDKLVAAAQAKANDMAARNYWAHNTPDGNPPWVFFDQAGYHYQKAGENLAYGFINSNDAVIGWMNSPPHRANLLDDTFSEVGFGYANVENYQDKGPETIVVAEYGAPRITLTPAPTSGIPLSGSTNGISTVAGSTTTATEPLSHRILVSQLLGGGRLSWLNGALLAALLLGTCYLFIKHSLSLRRLLLKGERFVLRHPLFDLTLVAFMGLCLMLSQAAGIIR